MFQVSVVGEVEVDTVEVTEVGIGEALGATVPITEHEAGELFSSLLMYDRLTFLLQRTWTGILTLMRNVGTLGASVFLSFICLKYTLHHYIYSSSPV
jgi:hypothetical protein